MHYYVNYTLTPLIICFILVPQPNVKKKISWQTMIVHGIEHNHGVFPIPFCLSIMQARGSYYVWSSLHPTVHMGYESCYGHLILKLNSRRVSTECLYYTSESFTVWVHGVCVCNVDNACGVMGVWL